MKIFVSGHRGLLGSACVRHFKKNHEVVVFEGDITDLSLFYCWMRQHKPEAIINCAAKVGGVKANRDRPVDFLLGNLLIQNSVIKAAFDFECEKLVFIATSCLYPKFALIPVEEESLLTGKFEPDVQAYAIAKLAGHELCNAYRSQFGKNFTTVAPCNLYGIGDNYGPSAHVIPGLMNRVLECSKSHKPLSVWGDGNQVREFLFADDCAEAIEFVLNKWNSPDLINIGSGLGTSIKILVDLILGVSGIDLDVVYDKTKPIGIYHKTFSVKKIQKLGWGPIHSLEEGLKKTWADFVNNKNPRFT